MLKEKEVDSAGPGRVSLDTALAMRWPVALAWSPDAKAVAYQVMGTTGGEMRMRDLASGEGRRLREISPQAAADLRWSRDGSQLIYKEAGAYLSVAVADGRARPLLHSVADPSGLSPDERAVWFIRDGDIWVLPLDAARPRRLTRGEDYLARDALLFKRLAFAPPKWSPDSASLAYISRMYYGGASRNLGTKAVVVSTSGETLLQIVSDTEQFMFTVVDWSPDGRRIAVARTSEDSHRKELLIADVASGAVRTVWVDTDERWVNYKTDSTYNVAWSRDGARLAFISNRDGRRHLYVLDVESGTTVQTTHGDFDVRSSVWSPDDRSIAFVANDGVPQRLLLWEIPSSGGERRQLVGDDICIDPKAPLVRWSRDGRRIAVAFSAPDAPFGLGVLERGAGQITRLWTGLPDGMTADDLAEMRAVSFPSADGSPVPGVLIASRKPAGAPRPALVYAYGGGGQHATLSWGHRGRSILFNHLAQAGYAVLLVDPRGSSGYGEEYEKGLYHDAAGAQSQDMVAAARYLAEREGVDAKRIAIYGHSYGGFFVAQVMIQAPEVFAAGITSAGQYDWTFDWQGSPVESRWGPPTTREALMKERTPIYHADKLQAPLFVVHGTADAHVPLACAESFVNELMKAGKTFEYMTYPGEVHDWKLPTTFRDFIPRLERFLRNHMA